MHLGSGFPSASRKSVRLYDLVSSELESFEPTNMESNRPGILPGAVSTRTGLVLRSCGGGVVEVNKSTHILFYLFSWTFLKHRTRS